jgi:ribonucleoside-diphosphate reductase alpha chain
VEDVAALHMLAWELGLKAVAIYRDNCKVGQPLSTVKKDTSATDAAADAAAGSGGDGSWRRLIQPAGAAQTAPDPDRTNL